MQMEVGMACAGFSYVTVTASAAQLDFLCASYWWCWVFPTVCMHKTPIKTMLCLEESKCVSASLG